MSKHKSIIYIRNWLYTSAFMVFAMAIIGAITRLTESGLSIVEWQPISGAIPPLTDMEWARVFDLYKQTPEYQKINSGMSLDEFKNIFFWEWFHRLWGRLIGLVYAIPLIFFWLKNMIPTGYKKPLIALLILGGMQGVMGYVMVLSGFVDRPSVSHYRLASHLSLAFVIFGCLIWTALSLNKQNTKEKKFCKRRHGWISLFMLSITVIWGAFMAGKDAGLISNTWPHMFDDGSIIPPDLFNHESILINILGNETTIHFVHRWLAFMTACVVIAFAIRVKSFPLIGVIILQFILGIFTVLTNVHIHVAVIHQAGAFILTGLLIKEIYFIKKL